MYSSCKLGCRIEVVKCPGMLSICKRTYPVLVSGLVSLCKPDGSGLQSLLGVLYLRNMETRVCVIAWLRLLRMSSVWLQCSLNADILRLLYIQFLVLLHPLAGYVYISNKLCSAKFVTHLTPFLFSKITYVKTEPQDAMSDIYYASLSKIIRDRALRRRYVVISTPHFLSSNV